MNKKSLCWMNHSIIAGHQATVSVFDHGLLYGDGIFEGLRFYHGKVFMLDAHLQRLEESADAIDLRLPMTKDEISGAIEDLIEQFDGDSGYLRLVVTRGKGTLGIDPLKCSEPLLFIIADQLSVVQKSDTSTGINLHVAKTRRLSADCLSPEIKSLNYLNNILARIEANKVGADEAVMLNQAGFVSEGTVDNLFIVSDGVLKTPPVSDGLLRGITRQVIIDLASENSIPCEIISLTIDDLEHADECFLTGTGAELIPVQSLGTKHFSGVAVTQKIMQLFKVKTENYRG